MTSYTEAAAQLRQDAHNPQLSGESFAALRAFGAAQVAAAKQPGGRPQFASLVNALDSHGLLALVNHTNFIGAWTGDIRSLLGRDLGPARALTESLRAASTQTVRRLVEIWQAEAPRASDERCQAIGLAMAKTMSYASDLGGAECQNAVEAFADALYRADASPEMKKRADAVIGHLMAQQSRGYREPFENVVAALDFRDAVARRRPTIDAAIDAAIQADMGVMRDIGMVLKNERGGDAPPRTEPKVRDVRMETYRLWEMEVNGRKVNGRDPFDGPAAIRTGADGKVVSHNYIWKGERLGADLGGALDTLKSIDPQGYAACARRFVDEFQGDPATLPEPLRAAHQEFTARALVVA